MGRRLLLLVFLGWEGWWLYQYVSRPIPDEEMQSVAAIACGVILPSALLALYLIVRVGICLFRSGRKIR
jgi:hypothetical protein